MSNLPSKRCTRCVLPDTFPGISFDEHGLCNFCAETPAAAELEKKRLQLKESLEQVIFEHKGRAHYDCIVAFSGGKDSSYTLTQLVKTYGLNCLAVTIDNGFMAEQARLNCKTVTRALGVDHLIYTPASQFVNKMYVSSVTQKDIHSKAAIKRASGICNSCINLINAYMIKAALQNNTFLIAGGYIGGQVPKDSAIMVINLQRKKQMDQIALKRYVAHFGEEAYRYFGLDDRLYAQGDKITVINPMLTLHVSEEKIVQEIQALGWRAPKNTGKNSSNCLLNDLGIAIHQKQYGFHPYVFEISEQVRQGTLDRQTALEKIEKIRAFSSLGWQVKKIGLDLAELENTYE
jgi:tRNA(Ile)-lysidine synthase TilS/MesJ